MTTVKKISNYTMKIIVLLAGFFLFSSVSLKKAAPAVELYGIVVDANTGLPVNSVYVYTISGEEEVLTNKKGEFKFVSWQPLPLSLTVVHKEFEKTQLKITDASKTILIKLKKK